jgi:putative peptidoglycan lipid II flippase
MMDRKDAGVLREGTGYIALSFAGKLTGFLRAAVVAAVFGATWMTDAFNMAFNIVVILFSIFGAVLSTTLIPNYTRVKAREGKERADHFASNVTSVFLLLVLTLVAAAWFAAPLLVRVMAPGYADAAKALTVQYTRWLLPSVVFMLLGFVSAALLQANRRFAVTALTSIPLGLAVILAAWLGKGAGVVALVVGTLLGNFLQWLMQEISMRRIVRIRPVLDFKDRDLHLLLLASLPVLAGTAAQQVGNVVDKMMASTLFVGSVTYVTNITLLMQLFQGTFILGIATVLYPRFSVSAAEGRHDELGAQVTRSLGFLSVFLIPSSVCAMLLAPELVSALFGHGAYGPEDVARTAHGFLFFAPGLLFLGIRDIMSRVFFALGDTRTPMVNGGIAVVLNVGLNLALVPILGLAGIGIANSVSIGVSATLMVIRLRKRLGKLHLRAFTADLVRSIAITVPTGLSAFLVQWVAGNRFGSIATLALSLGAAGIVYAGMVLALRPTCLEDYRKRILGRLQGSGKGARPTT